MNKKIKGCNKIIIVFLPFSFLHSYSVKLFTGHEICDLGLMESALESFNRPPLQKFRLINC